MQSSVRVPICLAIVLAASTAMAQEQRRHLDAHAHGQGTLAIAIEGKSLQVELEAPAGDIVGFEHAPASSSEKKAVADAKTRLATPGEIFTLPSVAGCKLAAAKVDILGAAAGTAKASPKHSHGKAAKPAEEAADAGRHSEFRATYAFDCDDTGKLQAIGFNYFKHFKGAEKLVVTIIGPKGQSRSEVTRARPVLDLAGTT